jgi:hypothetical protein
MCHASQGAVNTSSNKSQGSEKSSCPDDLDRNRTASFLQNEHQAFAMGFATCAGHGYGVWVAAGTGTGHVIGYPGPDAYPPTLTTVTSTRSRQLDLNYHHFQRRHSPDTSPPVNTHCCHTHTNCNASKDHQQTRWAQTMMECHPLGPGKKILFFSFSIN